MKKNRFQTNYREKCLVPDFTRQLAEELKLCGRDRTARAYLTTWRRLCLFTGDLLTFEKINTSLMLNFQTLLLKDGCSKNTISFYMRNLRAIYNKAIKAKIFKPRVSNPFEEVYTGIDKTRKRALTKAELSALALQLTIKDSPLEGCDDPIGEHIKRSTTNNCQLKKSQLYFLFSFYACGISFIDLAYLKKSDIINGEIRYTRKKTGSLLCIKVTPEINSIIQTFGAETAGSEYLLPILFANKKASLRTQYETALRTQNERLKKLAELSGIEKNLSTHVARHTWATIAKQLNEPLSVISESLGHNSTKTTEIYLGSLEQSVLDRLNENVCKAIKIAI